jgi:hypothetical protein
MWCYRMVFDVVQAGQDGRSEMKINARFSEHG